MLGFPVGHTINEMQRFPLVQNITCVLAVLAYVSYFWWAFGSREMLKYYVEIRVLLLELAKLRWRKSRAPVFGWQVCHWYWTGLAGLLSRTVGCHVVIIRVLLTWVTAQQYVGWGEFIIL
jgi:hypothetical protein